jgi:hypothetical protein
MLESFIVNLSKTQIEAPEAREMSQVLKHLARYLGAAQIEMLQMFPALKTSNTIFGQRFRIVAAQLDHVFERLQMLKAGISNLCVRKIQFLQATQLPHSCQVRIRHPGRRQVELDDIALRILEEPSATERYLEQQDQEESH